MAISETYSNLLTEEIIKDILSEGRSPTVSEITNRFNEFVADNDISKPLFDAEDYAVSYGENASASKFNNTNNAIYKDLKVLYKHMLKISDQAIVQFDRWRTESKMLEGRLDDLEERINSLLLVSRDTAGFFNFLQDNFNNNSKVDLPNSTAYVNIQKGLVHIGTSSAGATKIELSNLTEDNIEFVILSRNNLVSSASSENGSIRYVVDGTTTYWQDRVYTDKPGPVSAELKIDFTEEKEISRIDVDLHMANQNSSLQLTPLYSLDNYSWKQLPVTNYTRSVIDKTTFQFAPLKARYVKFIMTKPGYDQIHNELYTYEFGVDEISFYNEGFSENSSVVLISKPLSVVDGSGNPEKFSRVVLEVCEDVPENTSISYSVTASNDPTVPLVGFTDISPLGRTSSTKPLVLDFGDLDFITVPNVKISYNPESVTASGVNPAVEYNFIESISGAAAVVEDTEASDLRYLFLNSNDRILNHQISKDIDIAQGTLEVWRNVNTKGTTTTVRQQTNGWGYEDPYYKTTVYVSNSSGYSVDFGGKTVVVDGEATNGKINFAQGRHSIWVHKNNWRFVDDSVVTDLDTLKSADNLYPYNHRYLVEGFAYSSGYPASEEQVYRGFDIVAEYFMNEVSVLDMTSNVAVNDYSRFALDSDVEDPSRLVDGSPTSNTSSTTVFLLKVDEENPDFINENFMLRFKSVNSLFQYLRFKAVLTTEDNTRTPLLDSYRIKISS